MSEINYEPDNKEVLEKCCKIMSATSVARKLKDRSVYTRRRIEDIKLSQELKPLKQAEQDYI